MKRATLLALLFGVLLIATPFVRADSEEADDDDEYDEAVESPDGGPSTDEVVVLTAKNFDDTVKKSKYALVEFYAPWCGHCKKLDPEYKVAAAAIKEYDPSIVIGKVDATVETTLGTEYEVQGYPTIKWFVDGEVAMDYNGGRDAEGIIKWVKKKTGPATFPAADKDALSKIEEESQVLLVGYFKEEKGAEWDAFQAAATKTEDAVFVTTNDSEAAKAAGLTKVNTVAVVTNFPGEERATIPAGKGKVTEASILELVKAERLPTVIPFNEANSQKIFGAGVSRQILLVAKADDLSRDAKLGKAYRKVAEANKGKLVFVSVDMSDKEASAPVANFFGVAEGDIPVVVGFEMAKNKKYRLRDSVTEKNIKKFAAGLIDDTIKPDYKSAPIPADNKDGDVTIVVGKSFDEIVKDKSKDVLLEVYAPWCGHCKSLEPIYQKLAKRFNKVDTVVIAKMDGTENEHEAVDAKGFPTILLFPAGDDKTPINFEGGDRSLKALTKFIKQNAKTSFELPKRGKKDDDDSASQKDEL